MDSIVEYLKSNVRSLTDILKLNKSDLTASYPKEIKYKSGIYSFWWIGDKTPIVNSNRKVGIVGPNTSTDNIIIATWDWNLDNEIIPLYIGKSTNIDFRIRQHLMLGTPDWYKDDKEKLTLKKRTTACQFRSGFEHLFKNENLETRKRYLCENIGFSYYILDGKENFIDRFYLEDYLIGALRPWFNLDSER